MTDTNDLTATVASLKDGDRVRATFTYDNGDEDVVTRRAVAGSVSSASLRAGGYMLRHADGSLGENLTAVEVLAPALPPEADDYADWLAAPKAAPRLGMGDLTCVHCGRPVAPEPMSTTGFTHPTGGGGHVVACAPALLPEPPVGTPVWFRERWMARFIEGGRYYPLRSEDRHLYVTDDSTVKYGSGLTWAEIQPCVPAVPQPRTATTVEVDGFVMPENREDTDEPDVPVGSVAVFRSKRGDLITAWKWTDGTWSGWSWVRNAAAYGAPVAVIPAGGE